MRREGEEKGRKEEGESLGIIGILAVDAVSGVGMMLLMQILLFFVCVCVCHCSVIAPINKLAVSCMQLCVCVCVCVRAHVCVCVLATLCNSCEEMATYVLCYSWRPHSYICRSKHIVMEIMVGETITEIMA